MERALVVMQGLVDFITQATQPMGRMMLTSDGDMRLMVRRLSRANGVASSRMPQAYRRDWTWPMAEPVMLRQTLGATVTDSNLLGPQEGSTTDAKIVSSAGYLIHLSWDLPTVGLFRSTGELGSLCPPPTHGEEGRLSVAGHVALGGRATRIRASLYSSLGPVPVKSTTFVGRRSWVGLKSLGTCSVRE